MDSGGSEEVRVEGQRGGGVSFWNEVGFHEQAFRWTVWEGETNNVQEMAITDGSLLIRLYPSALITKENNCFLPTVRTCIRKHFCTIFWYSLF